MTRTTARNAAAADTRTAERPAAGGADDKELTQGPHDPAICVRNIQTTQYVGKGYKSQFDCPVCGKRTWQNLNYLGLRDVICDGVKFSKRERAAGGQQ